MMGPQNMKLTLRVEEVLEETEFTAMVMPYEEDDGVAVLPDEDDDTKYEQICRDLVALLNAQPGLNAEYDPNVDDGIHVTSGPKLLS